MNNTLLQKKFSFNRYNFSKYKYTDSLSGSVYNYLAYMIKGRAKIVTKTKTIIINEGDVFYIPKNTSYQSYWYGNDDIEFISLGFLELEAKEYINIELQSIRADNQTKEALLVVPTNGHSVTFDTLYKFFYAFKSAIPILSQNTANRKKQLLEQVKKEIINNPFTSLPTIAKNCNISEPYMYSLFKNNTNYTPNEYRQKALCDIAIRLLLTTDKSVEEICSDLNFSSSSYFRKVLKKYTNQTPRDIRNKRSF